MGFCESKLVDMIETLRKAGKHVCSEAFLGDSSVGCSQLLIHAFLDACCKQCDNVVASIT